MAKKGAAGSKHTPAAKRGVKANRRGAAADAPVHITDTSTDESVGSYTNEQNADVVDTVCPKGHPSGKGQVATGYLGKATCGVCGSYLVAKKNSAATNKKNSDGGNLIDAAEALNMPGIPKHAPNPEFVAKASEARRKVRTGTPKMDSKGGENVTVAREP